jgi:hypothetical protein
LFIFTFTGDSQAKPEGRRLAGLTRLELATFRVTGGRSNQLSYSPEYVSGKWLLGQDSNLRPND